MKILDNRGDYKLINRDKNYIVECCGKVELLTQNYELAVEYFLQAAKGV